MVDRDTLIAAARKAATALGKPTLSVGEFERDTKFGRRQIYARFGGWKELCLAAGLTPYTRNDPVPNEMMFARLRDTFLKLGGIGSIRRVAGEYAHTALLLNRYRRWPAALAAFRRWAEVNDPAFPYMGDLPNAAPALAPPASRAKRARPEGAATTGGRQYGELLDLPGLQHAPVNEQGVVFLFGILATQLGYRVESIAHGFPDCEAKRRVPNAVGRWERVQIEFEFQSRSFLAHHHDPAGCDLIVCWEHNWAEAPIEVLELKSVVAAGTAARLA